MASQLGGKLIPQGTRQGNVVGVKVFTPAATYPSGSDPTKHYIVCEVNDGSTSCDCMGWTRRNPPGGRTCKHTEDYVTYLRHFWQGMAATDQVCKILVQEKDGTKGGALTDLFARLNKLDKGAAKC